MNLATLDPQAREIIHRYDEPRAAVLPLLWLVQESFGHISPEAEHWVGGLSGVAVSHIREVVSFYTMFRTQAAGRRELRVCTSLPCMLRGAEAVLAQLEDRLRIRPGETTPDGGLTLTEVECLCACEMAPMAQLDDEFIGPLDAGTLETVVRRALEPGAPGAAAALGWKPGPPARQPPGVKPDAATSRRPRSIANRTCPRMALCCPRDSEIPTERGGTRTSRAEVTPLRRSR